MYCYSLNRPLLCARNEGGMPLHPRLENFETSLSDILPADTVQTLEANLHFLNISDDAVKKALHEKQTGQFYSSLEERLTSMLSHDEYAGELEIRGLVYSSCCPIFLYQLQNSIPQYYSKYGDEQIPSIEPLRILYHLDPPTSKVIMTSLFVNHHGIDTAKSVLDQNTVKGDSLNLMKHLCRTAGSINRDISISEVFSDKKMTVEVTAGEGSGCSRDLPSRGRTLKEAIVNVSLDYHTQLLKRPFQRAQQYSLLILQDFKINEVEKTSLNYLRSVLFEYSVQCNIVHSSLSEEAVF